MLKWIPLLLVAAAMSLSGCKKTDTAKPEPEVPAVLPEPPELEPIEDAFPDPESDTAPAKKVSGPVNPGLGIVKDGPYTLQVGIYNTEHLARNKAENLKKQGFPAYITRVEDPTPALQGVYYRVRIGSFATTRAAREYGQTNLAPEGIDFWADLKGRDSQPVKQIFNSQPAAPAAAPAPIQAPRATEPPPAVPTPAEPAADTKPAPKLPDW